MSMGQGAGALSSGGGGKGGANPTGAAMNAARLGNPVVTAPNPTINPRMAALASQLSNIGNGQNFNPGAAMMQMAQAQRLNAMGGANAAVPQQPMSGPGGTPAIPPPSVPPVPAPSAGVQLPASIPQMPISALGGTAPDWASILRSRGISLPAVRGM